MAKECAICGKRGKVVWRRVRLRATKYNPTAKRKQYPNLQSVTLPSGKKTVACAKCIKTLGKTRTK